MMHRFKVIFISLITFYSIYSWGQSDSTLSQKDLHQQGFSLVYGNHDYDIEDFLLFNIHKVILLKKSNGALFHLLNNNNTRLDSKVFNSAPSGIKFWKEGKRFFYHSMMFYKSALCNLNFKPGIASFNIEDDKIYFNECIAIKNDQELNFHKTLYRKYKTSILDKSHCKKRRKKKSGSSCNIKINVNGKEILSRTIPGFQSNINSYLPYIELNNHLYILDALNNQFYIITEEFEVQTLSMKTSPLFNDSLNCVDNYELIADQATNKLYLLASRLYMSDSKRSSSIVKQQQILYQLYQNDWKKLDLKFPALCHKLKIDHTDLYAIFEVLNKHGVARKMLYRMNKTIN